MTNMIKAIEIKKGMTVRIPNALRSDTWKFDGLAVTATHDVVYGKFQSWNDGAIYIHGPRDDAAEYPVRIYDLAEVEVISYDKV